MEDDTCIDFWVDTWLNTYIDVYVNYSVDACASVDGFFKLLFEWLTIKSFIFINNSFL